MLLLRTYWCTFQGLFELAGGLGFAVGPVIGGALYQLGGFRLPFLSVGVFVLLSVVPCFILVRSSGIVILYYPIIICLKRDAIATVLVY